MWWRSISVVKLQATRYGSASLQEKAGELIYSTQEREPTKLQISESGWLAIELGPMGSRGVLDKTIVIFTRSELGVPVFNTKSTSIRFAETCHALGLTHSQVTYPTAKLNYEDFTRRAFEA